MRIEPIAIAAFVFALVMLASAYAAQGTAYSDCDYPLSTPSAVYKCYNKLETPYCPGQDLTYVPGWCPGGNNIQCCAPEGTPEGPRTGGPGLSYLGFCDAPLGSYKCYDINKHTCEEGLTYIRGWCPGGNNIQCCAPPGTQTGKRVYGPGIVTNLPANVQVQDFQFYLDGAGTCEYVVKSRDIETKKARAECGTWVTITVGPNGDCRDEGENTCEVTGGTTARTFSITFYRPTSGYGACRKYTSSRCVDKTECSATGGTPVRAYCSTAPSNIACCIYQQTFASGDAFAYDSTGTLSMSSIDNELRLISADYDAKIIIEVVDKIPPNPEQSLLSLFDFKYRLQDSGKRLTMIILYGKAEKRWEILRGSENCGIEESTLRKIISDDSVKKNAEEGNYDAAFENLVKQLKAVIADKSNSGDICRERFDVKDCKKECDSLLGCSLEKCVSMDGCMWNNKNVNDAQGASSGGCENICPGERRTEVVVVKKGETCNVPNDARGVSQLECDDVYLCRNGLPENPVKAAFSKTSTSTDISTQCEGVSQSFIDKYNTYRDIIDAKISKYQLALTDNPRAFVAALISKESAWNENAQSSSSTGIMQINVPVHTECDQQKIRSYDVDANIDCGVRFLSNLAITQTGDVGSKVYDCKGKTYGTLAEVALRYYNGWPSRCLNDPNREDEDFVEDIMGQRENPRYTANYPRWKACLEQQPAQTTDANVFSLPEGKYEITGKNQKGQPSQCNLNVGYIQNYWLGINDKERSLQCVGMHDTDSKCPEVDSGKIGQLFSSVPVGTKVTVKEPYETSPSDSNGPITGKVAITGYAATNSGSVCNAVCSGFIDKAYMYLSTDKTKNCIKRCYQLGCDWNVESSGCTHSELCLIHEENKGTNKNARRVLFIPILDYDYEAFESIIDEELNPFLNMLPSDCRNKFIAKLPTKAEFERFNKNVCPVKPRDLKDIARSYGYNPDQFDIIVGLGGVIRPETLASSTCLARETRQVTDLGKGYIWISIDAFEDFAHEMGHLFELSDQYCSQEAGSKDSRCNKATDINPLLSEYGCDPKATAGPNVCCGKVAGFQKDCSEAGYELCCKGNKVGNERGVMGIGLGTGFDPNELGQITTALGCSAQKSLQDSNAVFEIVNINLFGEENV